MSAREAVYLPMVTEVLVTYLGQYMSAREAVYPPDKAKSTAPNQ